MAYIGDLDEFLDSQQVGNFAQYLACMPLQRDAKGRNPPKEAHRRGTLKKQAKRFSKHGLPETVAEVQEEHATTNWHQSRTTNSPSRREAVYCHSSVHQSCVAPLFHSELETSETSGHGTFKPPPGLGLPAAPPAQWAIRPPPGLDPPSTALAPPLRQNTGATCGGLRSRSLDVIPRQSPIARMLHKRFEQDKEIPLAMNIHERASDIITAYSKLGVNSLFFVPHSLKEQPELLGSSRSAPTLLTQTELSQLSFSNKMAQMHLRHECQPCAYFHAKLDGCRWGADCNYCHLCPSGEIRKRKKQKISKLKALRDLSSASGSISDCSTSCSSGS